MSLHHLDPNPNGRPAVLLLHGLGMDGSSWAMQILPLAEAGFRPLAPDLPGFGRSPALKTWTVRRVTAALAAWANDLDPGPLHVCGISMGGVIALQFALDYSHLTRRLVLANTFARLRPDRLSGWLYFAWRFVLVHAVGLPAQARFVAQRLFPHPGQEPLRQELIARIVQADPRAYRSAMRALGFFNVKSRLREISVPTLVLTAEEDATVAPRSQRELAAGIPGARQVFIPGAGHAVCVEQSERFNRELIDFLAGG
jgi:3-oxoadipate enol-lactonase